MPATTLSSHEFSRDATGARKAALLGPVFITDRGTPAHVLITIEEYRRLAGSNAGWLDAIGLPPGVADAELDLVASRDPARSSTFD